MIVPFLQIQYLTPVGFSEAACGNVKLRHKTSLCQLLQIFYSDCDVSSLWYWKQLNLFFKDLVSTVTLFKPSERKVTFSIDSSDVSFGHSF